MAESMGSDLAANSAAEASTAEMASIRNRLAKPTLKTRTAISAGETGANETWARESYHWKSHTGEESEPRPSQKQSLLTTGPATPIEEVRRFVPLSMILLPFPNRLQGITAGNKSGPNINVSVDRSSFPLSLFSLLSSAASLLSLEPVSLPCL